MKAPWGRWSCAAIAAVWAAAALHYATRELPRRHAPEQRPAVGSRPAM